MIKSKDLIKGIGNYKATTKYYDDRSSTYDTSLQKWSYRDPSKASLILKTYITTPLRNILDLVCGTGLFAESIIIFSLKLLLMEWIFLKRFCSRLKKKKFITNYFVLTLIAILLSKKNMI